MEPRRRRRSDSRPDPAADLGRVPPYEPVRVRGGAAGLFDSAGAAGGEGTVDVQPGADVLEDGRTVGRSGGQVAVGGRQAESSLRTCLPVRPSDRLNARPSPSPPSRLPLPPVYLSPVHSSLSALGVALLVVACSREPEHLSLDKLPASTRAPAPSSLLRFPDAGGPATLYRIPSLDPSSWKAEDPLPPVQRIIGADAEQGLVFSLDRKRNLVTLDLETRRVRTYLDQVRAATMGPDGALYAVDTGSTVTQMVRRVPVRFRSKLQGTPQELYATITGALLARSGEKAPVLEVLGPDQAPVTTTLPSDRFIPSFYGDLVAVATDTAVILYQTQGKNAPKSIRLSGHPQAVAFSPSGHRLYVAQQSKALLVRSEEHTSE